MKTKGIFSYIQIVILACLMMCNGGKVLTVSVKTNEFPCKGHQCGCISNSRSLSDLSFTAKYVLDVKVSLSKESFFCFNSNNTSICPPEVFLSPPEKPPRRFI